MADQPPLTDRFQPDYTPEQLENLGVYDALYRGKAPRIASLGEWKPEWISAHDPKGWAQWYKRYSAGRRLGEEDERQIKRWLNFKSRHGGPFSKKPTPRRGWALRNWGIDPAKLVAAEEQARVGEMLDDYQRKAMQKYVQEKRAELQVGQTLNIKTPEPPKPPSVPKTKFPKPPQAMGGAVSGRQSLGQNISRWYDNAGGLNKAVNSAQQAQQNRDPFTLDSQTWPTWKPENITAQTNVTVGDKGMAPPGHADASGTWSANSGRVWVDQDAPNSQAVLEHELSHNAFSQNADVRQQQITSANRPTGNWGTSNLAGDSERKKYLFDPAEVDVRLAEVKRRYAHHTGQLVETPQQAQNAWDWWQRNQSDLTQPHWDAEGNDQPAMNAPEDAPTGEFFDFEYYNNLPDDQKQQLFHRMPELVQQRGQQAFKQAELIPELKLQEHQQRVADRITGDDPRLLVYHGLGTGKSLASIAAAEMARSNSGRQYGIVVPASLRGNFQKEVKKFTRNSNPEIMSYTGLGLGKKFTEPPETLIMDEAARLRNPQAASTRAAMQQALQAKRLLLLTGTPITNSPGDLASLVSMLNDKYITPKDFENRFVGQKKVSPGVLGWFRGVKPGTKPYIKNEAELRKLLEGKVDYQPSRTPEGVNVNEEVVRVPLSDEQQKIQRAIRTKIPPGFLWKLDQEFPLSKDELSRLNSFLTGMRQVGLSTRPFRADKDPLKAFDQSAKLRTAFENLQKKFETDPRKKAIIYSNFIDAGLRPYAAALERAKIPHAFFHGGVSPKVRQAAVDAYNKGKLRALLIGPAGAEGISTKGTSLIQLLDPHWNEARSQQAKGRGLRFDSHRDLPEELKNVAVQRYIAASQEPPAWKRWLLQQKRERTGDEVLERLTAEKEQFNDEFRQLLQEVGSRG